MFLSSVVCGIVCGVVLFSHFYGLCRGTKVVCLSTLLATSSSPPTSFPSGSGGGSSW